MKQEPGWAFAGSGLDRATGLRADPVALAAALAAPGARVLPVWQGRLLVEEGARLGWLSAGHPVLAGAAAAPMLLGLEAGAARFAQDIAPWQPTAGSAPAPGFLDPFEPGHPALPETFRFTDLRGVMGLLSPRAAELAAMARALTGWHASHRFCAACGAASLPAQSGWQRLCPACGAAHFPRTDPVVIMLVTHGNATLIGRSPGWPDGMYSCLAGYIEPGETVEAAVRREVAEETGVQVGSVCQVGSQPWPFPASLMLGCHGRAETTAITPDPAEIEDACWITREDLAQVFAGHHATIRAPRVGAIAHGLMRRWLADRL